MSNPPAWCDTPELQKHWRAPHDVPLDGRKARVFKRRCWEHGLLSPNFSRAECASHDGAQITEKMRNGAQRQAFRMERYRHATGDKPLGFLDWLRSPSENKRVGGATNSQHLYGTATDRTFEPSIATRIWKAGGIGWAGPGVGRGMILHTDSRRGPGLAQWAYS